MNIPSRWGPFPPSWLHAKQTCDHSVRQAMCRFLVVYRLVNTVWVIIVAPASSNVVLCSHVITATIRVLIAASKGTDVTPDKLARSYPEVHSLAFQQQTKYSALKSHSQMSLCPSLLKCWSNPLVAVAMLGCSQEISHKWSSLRHFHQSVGPYFACGMVETIWQC